MLITTSMLSLEEMFWLVSLILNLAKEQLLIMNLKMGINCAIFYLMVIVLLLVEVESKLIWENIPKFMSNNNYFWF